MRELEKYAVRLHRKAAEDIDDAHKQIAEFSGNAYADAWQDGLRDAIASLATLSRRYPPADENNLFQNIVWACPYRFQTSRVVHRILYEIAQDDQDGPFVHVLHIRHGARKPMTRAEARKIDEDAS